MSNLTFHNSISAFRRKPLVSYPRDQKLQQLSPRGHEQMDDEAAQRDFSRFVVLTASWGANRRYCCVYHTLTDHGGTEKAARPSVLLLLSQRPRRRTASHFKPDQDPAKWTKMVAVPDCPLSCQALSLSKRGMSLSQAVVHLLPSLRDKPSCLCRFVPARDARLHPRHR